MEQTLITKIAIVILAMIVITLLMGFYQQFEKLLDADKANQDKRDLAIQQIFQDAHTKLFIVIIQDSQTLR